MKENELISIIVPAYNAENYIQQTITSILNQTYKNIEIILVNDGSKDNTLQVMKSIASQDGRIKVYNKANEGVTQARKYGFENAQGKYIGFVDADDYIDATMYEHLYNNLLKYNAEISHCGHEVEWGSGKRKQFYNTRCLVQQNSISGLQSLITGAFEPSLCNKLYHRILLQDLFQSGVMDYSIRINEDLLMNYYLFKVANKSVYEDVCLYHYIKREGSASSSEMNYNHIWDQINVKKIIMEDSVGTNYENTARKAYLLTCIRVYNSINRAKKAEYNTDQKKIRELIKYNKRDIKLLNGKYHLIARMIIIVPAFYKLLYKLLT